MGRPAQILVADDDRTVRTVISHALRKQGYRVGAAASVAGLWDMTTAGRGDVLITDVRFPDGDALDLLPRLTERRPDLTIIVMSAQANLLTAIKTQQRGVFDYLPKPFELRHLLDVVSRAVVDGHHNDAGDSGGTGAGRPITAVPKQIPAPLMGRSRAMQAAFKELSRISALSFPILIRAGSGTGKQIIAQTLHEMSNLSSASFNAVDLSLIDPEQHAERLFGASGVLTALSSGTMFLNNIDHLSLHAQSLMAHFIGARNPATGLISSIRTPLHPIQSDGLRLICGTSSDLKERVNKGAFREDLHFSLSPAELVIPPLRDRPEDIPQLARWYCSQLSAEFQFDRWLSPEAVVRFQNYHWPGNIKELEGILKRLFTFTTERQISVAAVEKELNKNISSAPETGQNPPAEMPDKVPDNLSQSVEVHLARYFSALEGDEPDAGLYERILAEVERPLIRAILHQTAGNQIKAAAILGLNRNTLRKKIAELKIPTNRAEYR